MGIVRSKLGQHLYMRVKAVPPHIGAVKNGPQSNTCLWIRRWATMNARGCDGPVMHWQAFRLLA